jgi:hypothetical protein
MQPQSAAQRGRVPKQRQVHFHALVHGGSREARSDSSAVGFGGQLCPDLGQVRLPVGILDVRQQLGPFPREIQPTPPQVTGRTHRRRIARGLREHAPAQEHSDLVGIDRVVFGLAPMTGLHGERMPQDKGQLCARAEGSQPVPGKDTLDSNEDILTLRSHGPQQGIRTGFHVLMHENIASLVEAADIHRPRVQVDPAIRLLLLGVELHEVSSSLFFS